MSQCSQCLTVQCSHYYEIERAYERGVRAAAECVVPGGDRENILALLDKNLTKDEDG